jgi:hypothetical protein
MLSNTRAEIRRRRFGYRAEAAVCQWVNRFLDETGIDHSGQLAGWQIDHFIASLKGNERYTTADIMQARSAIHFLFEKVTGRKNDPEVSGDSDVVLRIPA